MPIRATIVSRTLRPLSAAAATSSWLIGRDAIAMSAWPARRSSIPWLVPVATMSSGGALAVCAKLSAHCTTTGWRFFDPRITIGASAAPAHAALKKMVATKHPNVKRAARRHKLEYRLLD
jgi:hypothetical protein